MNLYIAAPWCDAPFVHEINAHLQALKIVTVSSWTRAATGEPEELARQNVETNRELARRNDTELRRAHVLLALPRENAGGEMFAEVRLALAHRVPVLWLGRRLILSAFREGVYRAASMEEVVSILAELGAIARAHQPFEHRAIREALWIRVVEIAQVADEPGKSAA